MIKTLIAKQILDSRKKPTVRVKLKTDHGVFFASCPSGASTGKNEAVVLPAEKAILNINKIIAPQLAGRDETRQEELDRLLIDLDGTKNKKKLGANAMLPVSMAICRAGARAEKLPLFRHINQIFGGRNVFYMPKPCFNILNGGAHTGGKELDIQEFMVVPQDSSFYSNLKTGKRIFKKLKRMIRRKLGWKAAGLGDEGGFAPEISDPKEVLDLLSKSSLGFKAKIGLDCAATQFYKGRKYILNNKKYDKEGLLEYYKDIVESFSIIFIEDPFAENDSKGFENITSEMGKRIAVVGDDFLTTNPERMKKAEKCKACNGVIIKLNQIGTVSETLEAVRLAKSYGWKVIVSHRSGETMDDFIADLSVGVLADYIKSGAPSRPERMVKYKRLVKIEKELK